MSIKPLKILFFAILVMLLTAACAPSTTPITAVQSDKPVQRDGQAVLNRDIQNSYSAQFKIQFSGARSWGYDLKTRKISTLREINLHLEGLDKAQNPGDIRLVTDGAQTWMLGAGTDQECIQFPNQQGMDPIFIYPESLVSMPEIDGAFELVGEEPAERVPSGGPVTLQHYRASGAASGPWKNATIDIWQEKTDGMLYQFSMQAEGEDPFFAAGAGRLSAHYQVIVLGEPAIEPVAGCEISVKLPESFTNFVRLPGMASFESKTSVDELQQFYQMLMTQENWIETTPAALADGATVLSYSRDAQEVQIVIEALAAGGSKVTLLFIQSQ